MFPEQTWRTEKRYLKAEKLIYNKAIYREILIKLLKNTEVFLSKIL